SGPRLSGQSAARLLHAPGGHQPVSGQPPLRARYSQRLSRNASVSGYIADCASDHHLVARSESRAARCSGKMTNSMPTAPDLTMPAPSTALRRGLLVLICLVLAGCQSLPFQRQQGESAPPAGSIGQAIELLQDGDE